MTDEPPNPNSVAKMASFDRLSPALQEELKRVGCDPREVEAHKHIFGEPDAIYVLRRIPNYDPVWRRK